MQIRKQPHSIRFDDDDDGGGGGNGGDVRTNEEN